MRIIHSVLEFNTLLATKHPNGQFIRLRYGLLSPEENEKTPLHLKGNFNKTFVVPEISIGLFLIND